MENPNANLADAEESMENMTIEFGPTEIVHEWSRLPECDEVVGSRSDAAFFFFSVEMYLFESDSNILHSKISWIMCCCFLNCCYC